MSKSRTLIWLLVEVALSIVVITLMFTRSNPIIGLSGIALFGAGYFVARGAYIISRRSKKERSVYDPLAVFHWKQYKPAAKQGDAAFHPVKDPTAEAPHNPADPSSS